MLGHVRKTTKLRSKWRERSTDRSRRREKNEGEEKVKEWEKKN